MEYLLEVKYLYYHVAFFITFTIRQIVSILSF